jgi:hypothetical protein
MDWRWRRRTVLQGRLRWLGIVSCFLAPHELGRFLAALHELLVIMTSELILPD